MIEKNNKNKIDYLFQISDNDNTPIMNDYNVTDNTNSHNNIKNNAIKPCTYFKRLINSVDNVNLNSLSDTIIPLSLNESNSNLTIFDLNYQQFILLESSIIISLFALIISLSVYCLLPNLRTKPGKCLMGLIFSEIFSNVVLISAINIPRYQSKFVCISITLLMQYSLFIMLCWFNLIAIDILRKIRNPMLVLKGISQYSIIAYTFPIIIISLALSMDFLHDHYQVGIVTGDNKNNTNNNNDNSNNGLNILIKIQSFRPNYCANERFGIDNIRAHFLFIILPLLLSFAFNLVTLISVIIAIKSSTSRPSATKIEYFHNYNRRSTTSYHSKSLNRRFVWYIKIFILLGVLNFLTLTSNVFLDNCRVTTFWSLLSLSSHGICIFIAFICKRSIFHRLYRQCWLDSSQNNRNTIILSTNNNNCTRKSCHFDIDTNNNNNNQSIIIHRFRDNNSADMDAHRKNIKSHEDTSI